MTKESEKKKEDQQQKPAVTPAEAAAVLQREEAARRQAFSRAVQQLQQQFRFRIIAAPQLTSEGRIVATVLYVPM